MTLDTTPVIITLCSDNDEYYWPGVGAQFSAAISFVQAAKNSASQVDKHQSHFAFCDVN
ncbi:hypothetical protein ACSTD2_19855 [Vibrio vulnificus]|nr:hypothetical protein [Vibrio vulnificus]